MLDPAAALRFGSSALLATGRGFIGGRDRTPGFGRGVPSAAATHSAATQRPPPRQQRETPECVFHFSGLSRPQTEGGCLRGPKAAGGCVAPPRFQNCSICYRLRWPKRRVALSRLSHHHYCAAATTDRTASPRATASRSARPRSSRTDQIASSSSASASGVMGRDGGTGGGTLPNDRDFCRVSGDCSSPCGGTSGHSQDLSGHQHPAIHRFFSLPQQLPVIVDYLR